MTDTGRMKKFKLNVTKPEIILIIIFGFALAFSMCIFNQFDILLHNQIEFGFSVGEVIVTFILLVLLVLLVVCSLLLIVAHFSKLAFKIVVSLLFGIMLACYVQVLFLNGSYNSGFQNFAAAYQPVSTSEKVVNVCLWVIVCLVPMSLVFTELFFKKIAKKDFFKRFILIGSVVIFGMQATGFVTTLASAENRTKENVYYFSVNEQLQLSEHENIIVFVLDRFATEYAEEVFYFHPYTKDFFKGFTFYRDNVSEYPGTFPSITTMLTGKPFEETEARESFSRKAWDEAILFDELHKKNYTVNAILDATSTYYNIDEVIGKIDNVKAASAKSRRVKQVSALAVMSHLALQRVSPYILKQAVHVNFQTALTDVIGYNLPDYFPRVITAKTDKVFKAKIEDLGLSADQQKNVFSFVHLNASHEIKRWFDATYDTLKMLDEYFLQMKQLGIYGSSTIILVADHGFGGGPNGRYSASLFIKPKGGSDSDLVIDSETKLSHRNFVSAILELIGSDYDKTVNPSYFDIIGGATQERSVYDTDWDWRTGKTVVFFGKRKID